MPLPAPVIQMVFLRVIRSLLSQIMGIIPRIAYHQHRHWGIKNGQNKINFTNANFNVGVTARILRQLGGGEA